ncbi:MAG TPA: SusC/RagA family TonB-linked outer membrane protein [Pseudobacter sp.]|nr:SusC/RagA family TonB-linked outer membrane protein [Pseudobacter sp.]
MYRTAYGHVAVKGLLLPQPGRSAPKPANPGKSALKWISFLMIACLSFSVSILKAQNITLTAKELRLKEVFKMIRKQTGYVVFYRQQQVATAKPVTLTATNMPLNAFLNLLLKDLPLDFKITDKTIVLFEKAQPSKSISGFNPQNYTPIQIVNDSLVSIRGKVVNQKEEPIAGVTIISRGIAPLMTNAKGEFTLQLIKGSLIALTHTSYVAKELIAASMQQPLKVVLIEKTQGLEEVVVVNKGYYTTTKALNTGSTSTVTAKDIEKQPVTNVLQALQSRVPGLVITQQSGVPGSNFNIELRGRNSINKSNPLFIIDGVPFSNDAMGQVAGNLFSGLSGTPTPSGNSSAAGAGGLSPLNSINPEDIESIDILKDADATAIYGSRGANGVILINTKRAKAGPLRVNGTVSYGFSNPSRMPEYLTTEQFLRYRRQVFANDNKTPGPIDYDLNGTWDTSRYTNWAEELIGKPASNLNTRLSVSGGNTNNQFQVSIGHTKATPPYEGNFSNDRSTVGFSLNNISNDKRFRMTVSGSYGFDKNTLPGADLAAYANLTPNAPALLKEDGSLNWWNASADNPYASLLRTYDAKTRTLVGNAMLSYQLLPSLEIKTSLGYTDLLFNETRINPFKAINPGTPGATATALAGNMTTNNWIVEPQAAYKQKLLGGTLSLLAGATFQSSLSEGSTVSATGFASDALLNNLSAANRFVINNRYVKYRYNALFGRINYTLHDRYSLNLTGRRDGSSRFAPGRQFDNFGAAGAAWVISNEQWMNKLSFISFAKIRGSVGITGNDQIGDYRYLDTYSPTNTFTYLGMSGILPTRVFNDTYGWESNKKMEMAIEFGLFKDRIFVTLARYRTIADNQLVLAPLAPSTGNSNVQENLQAKIRNTGTELEIASTNIDKGDFSWRTTFNISFQRNKLLSFPGLEFSSYRETYVIGEPLSITAASYRFVGVNPATGLYEFLDQEGKPTSKPALADRMVRLNLAQEYFGGISNSFRYKKIQLDIQLQFVKQLGRNSLMSSNLPFSNLLNMPGYYNDNIWLQPGDIKKIQKLTSGGFAPGVGDISTAALAATMSDYMFSDASYIRVKTVALGWQLNDRWAKQIGFKQIKVNAQAQNLFTITNYIGFDPESQGSVLPPLRTIVFGVQFML